WNMLDGQISDADGQRLGCAHTHRGAKLNSLLPHLFDAPVDQPLLHLEVRNAIAQQSADAIVLLEYDHAMPGSRQLLCTGKPSGPRTHYGHALAGLVFGRLRRDPAHLPAFVDDGVLDGLDSDWVVVDVEGAGFLARGGADAAGELGKIVGRV